MLDDDLYSRPTRHIPIWSEDRKPEEQPSPEERPAEGEREPDTTGERES